MCLVMALNLSKHHDYIRPTCQNLYYLLLNISIHLHIFKLLIRVSFYQRAYHSVYINLLPNNLNGYFAWLTLYEFDVHRLIQLHITLH